MNGNFPNDVGRLGPELLSNLSAWNGTSERDKSLRDFVRGNTGLDPASLAWCAAFINAGLEDLGVAGTNSFLAKSFATFGQPTNSPKPGDIVVFEPLTRGATGHVGLYGGKNPDGSISVFGGNQSNKAQWSNFSPDQVVSYRELGTPEYSAFGYSYNTPAEVQASNRNMQAQRDVFRGPSDFGAPVWDGMIDNTTLAAPVGAVSFGGNLPDVATAPGPDLGANLSSAVPSSDWSPNAPGAYDFSGMSAAPMAGLGTFGAGITPDVGSTAFSSRDMGSMGVNPGFGAGITPGTSPSVDLGYNPSRDMGSLGTWGGFSAGIDTSPRNSTLDAALSPSPIGPAQSFGSFSPSFSETTSFAKDAVPGSIGWGNRSAEKDTSPASYALGPNLGANLSSMVPSSDWNAPAKPNTAAATQTPELPGFVLPPEVTPPTTATTVAKAAPTQAPAIAAPQPVRSVNAPSQASSQSPQATQAAQAPSPMTPEAFLGSVMQGGSPAVAGMDNYGLGALAREGGIMAQPAMLGLENAYAAANGMQGTKGLFDGLFGGSWGISTPSWDNVFSGQNVGRVGGGILGGVVGGVPGAVLGGVLGNYVGGMFGGNGGISDGLGAVRDAQTGAVLGAFDPSDPAHNGYAGWGDSWGGGLGNTPGAGGLY